MFSITRLTAGVAGLLLTAGTIAEAAQSQPREEPDPSPSEEPDPGHQADPEAPVVYLTFDDGPHPDHTASVLEVLADYDAQATFFMLGQNASSSPGLVDQARSDGHAIANHTWNHPDLTTFSNEWIRLEIYDTADVLGGTDCVRPPYGAIDDRVAGVLDETGHTTWMWDVDPQDWSGVSAEVIADRVLANTGNGDVVLLHDGGGDRTQTVAALPLILDDLTAQGYELRALPGC